jgi:hypothetical protein
MRDEKYIQICRKPQGKRPFGKARHRSKDVKMDCTEIGWKGLVWIHVAQERDHWWAVMTMKMNFGFH